MVAKLVHHFIIYNNYFFASHRVLYREYHPTSGGLSALSARSHRGIGTCSYNRNAAPGTNTAKTPIKTPQKHRSKYHKNTDQNTAKTPIKTPQKHRSFN